jgi:hypothetical protein
MIGAVRIVLMGSFTVALLLATALSAQEQSLYVAPLARDGQVLVSFKLAQTLTPELKTAIHSGLTVSFVYKVDLKRDSAAWIDRTMASTVVTATVRYDNLTRKYHLSERLPLFRGVRLEDNAEYYVRVRAHTSPRNASFVWPWQGDDVVGLAKFTFFR